MSLIQNTTDTYKKQRINTIINPSQVLLPDSQSSDKIDEIEDDEQLKDYEIIELENKIKVYENKLQEKEKLINNLQYKINFMDGQKNNNYTSIYTDYCFEIIKTDINFIKHNFQIFPWSKTEPVNDNKKFELIDYYNNNNIKIIPGIITVWYINGVMHVIDGIHRISAGFHCNKNLNIIMKIYNDKINEEQIINEFQSINKCSISKYIDENDNYKLQICDTIIDKLCSNYKNFHTSADNPRKPNFNKKMVMNILSNLNIDFKQSNIVQKIYDALMCINTKARKQMIENNLDYSKKSSEENFFLFYLSNMTIKTDIEDEINL